MDHRALFLTLCSFGLLLQNDSSAGLPLQNDSTTEVGGVRLEGGASRCEGQVQVKHRGVDWTQVDVYSFNLRWANRACAQLHCGSAVSVSRDSSSEKQTWEIRAKCEESSLIDCVETKRRLSSSSLYLKCSDSVRLRGPRLCSGSLELHQNQSWAPVCEGDFDLQDAEVVCRELGCGAPSLLQGALYGEVQALGQTFLCEGHESALMDCPRSSSGNTCSSGTAVELTCSEPAGVRLVGGASRCAGTVELDRRGDWRPLFNVESLWDLTTTAAAVCRELKCGSAVSVKGRPVDQQRAVWSIEHECVKQTAALTECVDQGLEQAYYVVTDVICSDFLPRPTISLSVSADGVSEAQPQGLRVLLGSDFSVRCSVEPQYPGGSFQLLSPTVDPAQSHTLPAVNHSAHFLFSDAGSAHTGGYTCVYHLHVFSHNFSSQSLTLHLTVGALDSELIIRVVLILLLKIIYIPALYYYCKATRGQRPRQQ